PGGAGSAQLGQRPGNPVSEADLEVDRFLKRELLRLLPSAGWLSEETADDKARTTSGLIWLVDPIDGTRGLMYQKRSAWVLTGIAPNRGPRTRLRDIELAVQTEIPLVKQHLSDVLWAHADGPVYAQRYNRVSGETVPITLRPSRATTIAHGFAQISRFFPGAREELAALDEAVVRRVLGPPQAGKAQCFEDQYICTAGQFYELISGHDRYTADLRPLLDAWLAERGRALGICCHPYDLATALIAERAGIVLTDERGAALDAPFDVDANVGWIGYAMKPSAPRSSRRGWRSCTSAGCSKISGKRRLHLRFP
ncbi:hypothetical protein HC891_11880, partial [Candidatus Gracilibacteria bacterium]|nr:hypothetical protein [Candidatus Gracilibacteria bacterium]